jgi:hypothetical protein
LAANVNTFIEPLVYDIVKKRPADPVAHAQKWLVDFIGKIFVYLRSQEES